MLTCLENHTTRRCDVYERLVATDKPQSLIQPIKNTDEDSGFTLHLFDQSIGNQSSSSLIKSLSIHPIPLKFIQNISFDSLVIARNESDAAIYTNNSNLITTHPTEFIYTFSANTIGDSQLNLFQSYSPYWYAIKVSPSQLQGNLLTYVMKLPYLFLTQNKLTSLTSTSLWYNSWFLPKGESTLFIIYLPQYLEFFGFLIIFITIVLLLLRPFISVIANVYTRVAIPLHQATKKHLSKKKGAK
jgi:hypothetical protein